MNHQRQAELIAILATFTTLFLTAVRVIDALVLALIALFALLAILASIAWGTFAKLIGANVDPAWYGLLGLSTAAVVVIP